MGRIKSTQIKRVARKLFEEHKNLFTEDFEKNKVIVSKLIESSKKTRNVIAGYLTKLTRKLK